MDVKNTHSVTKTEISVFGRQALDAERRRSPSLADKVLMRDDIGTMNGVKGHLQVNSDAEPRFCKARNVPYALRDKVEEELSRLERDGIIEPVEFSDWAAPIVPVLEGNGQNVRICGDFKLTVNKASMLDTYPLPRIDDLYASLAGGQSFTKIDLKNAYLQIELEEEFKKYVTINTSRGLFQYNRLPFGVSSSPAIFSACDRQCSSENSLCVCLLR